MGPCFVVFAKELRGSRAEENSYLLKMGVGGLGAEVVSARVRLWMAGSEREVEWGQSRRVWSSLPTILLGRQDGQ